MNAWELASWDAVETVDHLQRRDVTPSEVIEAAITRAQETQSLNAIVTPTFERARASVGHTAGVLSGVPTFIKDLNQVSGVRTTWGSRSTGNYISKVNDPIVELINRTGLISLGKSALPEFGLTATTEPLAFGPTKNPWSLEHTAGGSSGGAAALVAAGVVPIAHGSDGGGSIRIPASCCGVVGFKASRYRLDMEGSHLMPVNLATHGVLTRSVRDTVTFFQAMEQLSPPKRVSSLGPIPPRPAQRLRIGAFIDAPEGTPVSAEVRRSIELTSQRLRSLGHHVREIACPVSSQVSRDFIALWALVAFTQTKIGRLLIGRPLKPSELEPWTLGFSKVFSSRLLANTNAIRRLRQLPRTYAGYLSDFDVLLFPTLGETPPKLGHLAPDVPFDEALERIRRFTPFTGLLNASGAPGISLPLAQSADGLPIGVQFSTAHGRDALLLSLALELEAAFPWVKAATRFSGSP